MAAGLSIARHPVLVSRLAFQLRPQHSPARDKDLLWVRWVVIRPDNQVIGRKEPRRETLFVSYNEHLHSSLGYLTPEEFAALWSAA